MASPPSTPAAAPTPLRDTLRLLLPLASVVALLLLLGGLISGAARWLATTDEGAAWLLKQLPMVQAKNFKGALLGSRWQADSLRVQWDGGRQWLLIEGLQADGMQWQWRPNAQAWVGLSVQNLAATKVTLHTVPNPNPKPLVLPQDLAPPVQLALGQARVDAFHLDGQAEPLLGALQLQGVTLDPQPGAVHRIERLAAQSRGVQLEGTLKLGNRAPLALQASANLQPLLDAPAPLWAATLQAQGPLQQLQLSGTLRGRPLPGRPAPALDLSTTLRPAAAWPLAALDLRTEALDLSALVQGAPQTRLTGQAQLSGGERGTPLKAAISLTNAEPGRWNEGRVPLRQIELDASGSLAQRDRLDVTRFELTLADARRSAGRWSGKASWLGHELDIDTRLDGVTPQQLDGRAAAMTLTGPLALKLRGLPSPDFQAAKPATALPWQATWKVDLEGKLDAAPLPVRVTLQGEADAGHVELAQARAQAGSAVAELKARLARAERQWRFETAGTLSNFDPLPWWPGDSGGAWRKGPHRLSGSWQFDVQLPPEVQKLAPLQLAHRIAGNGQLRLRESMLAGVALQADVTLGYAPARKPAPGTLNAELVLGGNRLVLDARGDPAGNGSGDRWQAELKADTLATLAPLMALDPALAPWALRRGSAEAKLTAEGRWPALRADAQASASLVQAGRFELARATLNGRFDLQGTQSVSGHVELAGLALGEQRADHLRADISGTLAQHDIEVSGALPLLPPPVAERMLAIQAQSGTRASIKAHGGWTPDPTGGGRWKAQVEQLLIGSWDGTAGAAPPASAWADARNLRGELQFSAEGRLVRVQADAGRLQLADTAALRWDDVLVDLRSQPAQITLRADVEPFALAPLLRRAQPGLGWDGDLKLRARIDVRAAERMDADIVFERSEGDLHVTLADVRQQLGLTQARIALQAHNGIWNFKPELRGSALGDIDGELRVQAAPEHRWPHADAPISGSVRAQVNDVGIWAAWVPAGWRLVGQLRAEAGVSGRFGAPLYTGEVTGKQLGVRNLLEGVNVTDGQVAIKLAGDVARVESFTFRGGDGKLDITGQASLGAKPQARLQIQADKFRVLGRVDRQIIVSGNAELQLQADSASLDGKYTIDEGLIDASRGNAPSLDDDVTIVQARQAPQARPAAGAAEQRLNLRLNVSLDLGQHLRVRGYGLDTLLTGQLQITAPDGKLQVHGTISSQDGTFAAYGQKLTIEHGNISFSGPLNNPRLDVLALRPNIDQRVGVLIAGNLLTYRLRLYSDPDMSDNDKLAWLVLGRAPDGLGRNDTALLQRAAIALFAGDGDAPTDQLMKRLGIDDISLGERTGTGDVRETVVTIGKQLSQRWYLGYERGVNSTTGTWQLIYRIAQRLTVRMQSGYENAIDVIWTWRFQETPPGAAMRKSIVTPP